MAELTLVLFLIDVIFLLILLFGASWSVAVPGKRLWPPPGKSSWQYKVSWILFYGVFGLNCMLIILGWNSWMFTSNLRWIVGVPLVALGSLLLSWGIHTLGTRNTSGIRDGFILSGPYRFTRNPQYLGDMVLFIGLSIISNSLYLWITHLLLILVFLIIPLAEETWLEDQYDENYHEYKNNTSRFL
jgi:protein-S-isoprenylcysteine O-methyltransferase Ste14